MPYRPIVQIGITVALPRHLVWLLTGITIGRHQLPDELPGRLGFIVDALRALG